MGGLGEEVEVEVPRRWPFVVVRLGGSLDIRCLDGSRVERGGHGIKGFMGGGNITYKMPWTVESKLALKRSLNAWARSIVRVAVLVIKVGLAHLVV